MLKNRKTIIVFIGILLIVDIAMMGYPYYKEYKSAYLRKRLFSELKSVALDNCILKRFGDAHDGGYLMCENLMREVKSAYSYGIGGRDQWGCDVSRQYDLLVHEYDCFDTRKPLCDGGKLIFHEECIGEKYFLSDKKLFDHLKNQVAKNRDDHRKLLVKMDVEGSEWDAFWATPDEILNDIDQLVVEFHGVDQLKYIQVLKKLKRLFYLVNVHYNNYSCGNQMQPVPAWAYEVLFVNKRIAKLAKAQPASYRHSPLDSPNNPSVRDCQVLP
jgi:hypothetical protein